MSTELSPFAMKSMRTGKVATVAQQQLDAWRVYAKRWSIYPEIRHTNDQHELGAGVEQLHLVCAGYRGHFDQSPPFGPCGQSIYTIHDGGHFRPFDLESIEALVIAHVRNVHRDIEEVVYRGTDLA